MASSDLVTVLPIGTSPGPHVTGPIWASLGPGVSGTHLDSIRIWLHCSLTVTQPDLLTLVFTWAKPGHLTLVHTWASTGLELVTLVLPGHHRDMVTLFPTGTDLILVTLVLTLPSSLPGDSGSTWASPVTGDSDPKHGLT